MNSEKTTRSLTLWILFLSVEQFREFRKGCSPSVNPSDVYPGIQYERIAQAMVDRKLYERLIGCTGTGTNNTVRQHLLRLVQMGMMYQRPGEPEVFIPTSKADDLFTAVEAEGILSYVMSRAGFRKLPELLAFAVLRRMPRTEWNLAHLARTTAIGDVNRLRDALNHISNYIEVQRGELTDRVRMRTESLGPMTIRVCSEDLVARDSSSSLVDQLDAPAAPAAPAAPVGAGSPAAESPEPPELSPSAPAPQPQLVPEVPAAEPLSSPIAVPGPCPQISARLAGAADPVLHAFQSLDSYVTKFCARLERGQVDPELASGVQHALDLAANVVANSLGIKGIAADRPAEPVPAALREALAGAKLAKVARSQPGVGREMLRILGELFTILAGQQDPA